MCYIGCQNMRQNPGCEMDILITPPHAVITVLIMLHLSFFSFFFFFIFLCDYAKQITALIIADTWAPPPHFGSEGILQQMINTASLSHLWHTFVCSFLKETDPWQSNLRPVYRLCHKTVRRLHLFSNLLLCVEWISHMLLLQIFWSKCDFVWWNDNNWY